MICVKLMSHSILQVERANILLMGLHREQHKWVYESSLCGRCVPRPPCTQPRPTKHQVNLAWFLYLTSIFLQFCCLLIYERPRPGFHPHYVVSAVVKDYFERVCYHLFEMEPFEPSACFKTIYLVDRFWRGLYCRFENGVHPRESLADLLIATRDHSSSLEDHIRLLQKVRQ